jgi:hypothetical protein
MSKKLIAVAAAAALALTALVAPANAAGSSLTVLPTTITEGLAGSQPAPSGSGLTSTAAWGIPVPSQDVLRLTSTVGRSVLALEVSTRSDNAAVSVTSTGAVKLVNASQLAASTTTTATGTQSLSLSANDSGKVTFYAYNTSTSAGSITVTEAGTTPASNTVWLKGTTDLNNAYKLTATSPTIAGLGSKVEYTATVVDMFGNALTTPVITGQTLGGDATPAGPTNMTYDTVTKVYEGEFTNRTTAGVTALLVNMAVSADTVKAFGAKTTSVFVSINGQDLNAAITALNAQVAALTAQITALTDEYNKLAARWNKKVANKTTLKKKVALK